jgi:hypothetical protein
VTSHPADVRIPPHPLDVGAAVDIPAPAPAAGVSAATISGAVSTGRSLPACLPASLRAGAVPGRLTNKKDPSQIASGWGHEHKE